MYDQARDCILRESSELKLDLAGCLAQAMLNVLRTARRFCTTRMPVGATPQILISAAGSHKGSVSMNAVTKITSLIVEHGASIAATKKIVMHD
jgi:hypothetical protein